MSAILLVLLAATLPIVQQNALASPATGSLPVANDVRVDVRGSARPIETAPSGMVRIPAGSVIMGTEEKQVARLGNNNPGQMTLVAAETPRHEVDVEDFFIDRTEVTNLQWKTFLDATRREPSEVLAQYHWVNGEIPTGQETYPITFVTIAEAKQFAQWSGKRLPTEAEWTRAARGDDDRLYPWGPKWDRKIVRGADSGQQRPTAVGSYPEGASPFGVLDMAGNANEWVDSPFEPFPKYKPIDFRQGRKVTVLSPSFSRSFRIIKGGSYLDTRDGSRIDVRRGIDPRDAYEVLGFRAARSQQDGIEAITHSYERLLPPRLKRDEVEFGDVFAKELTHYDPTSDVIKGHRWLAFAHPVKARNKKLASLRKSAREEQVVLGIVSTSEPLLVEPSGLPAGEYLVTWKTKGESKAYRDRKAAERKNGGGRRKDKKQDEPAPEATEGEGTTEGEAEKVVAPATGVAPWPGVNVNDIAQDIDYPQDIDVYVFYNVNDVAVGWLKTQPVTEEKYEPVKASEANGGTEWTIEFSLPSSNREDPRFTLPLKLHGEGLGG